MTTHLVTFSDESMIRSRELCVTSAQKYGCGVVSWIRAEELDDFELRRNVRGLGYWSWKPRIINSALNATDTFVPLKDGDTLIYADAGIEFIENVNYIIDRMTTDIFLFGNNWEHAHWCKADTLEEIMPWSTGNPDLPWCNTVLTYGKQCQASVIFFRVSDYTRRFVKELLDWCLFEGGRLIDDSPSHVRNHPEFREHRHDQAILTTMAYRDGIPLHYWPAQYNDGAFVYERGDYADEGYPVMFHHHRKRNHEWENAA